MSSQNPTKINQLLQGWPQGTVVTQTHLDQLSISRQLANKYIQSGWIERLGPSAYIRAGDTVGWLGGLYALQTQLDLSIHVGGRTALELWGRAHFIPMGKKKKVILVSDGPEYLPTWFCNYHWEAKLEHSCFSLFEGLVDHTVAKLNSGGFEINISSMERAIMEQMRLVRSNSDIDHIWQLMEGLNTLRPEIVQKLLETCYSIKVKRLFLWSAEEAGHDWFSRLDLTRVNLGKGKRYIYQGGELNRKYQITVPKNQERPNV